MLIENWNTTQERQYFNLITVICTSENKPLIITMNMNLRSWACRDSTPSTTLDNTTASATTMIGFGLISLLFSSQFRMGREQVFLHAGCNVLLIAKPTALKHRKDAQWTLDGWCQTTYLKVFLAFHTSRTASAPDNCRMYMPSSSTSHLQSHHSAGLKRAVH